MIPYYSIYQYIVHKLGLIKIQLFLIKGTIRNTSFPVTILFVGREIVASPSSNLLLGTKISPKERIKYFTSIILSKIEKLNFCGEFLYRQVNPNQFKNAEVIVIDPNIETTKNLLKKGFLLLPKVSFGLDLTRSIEELTARLSGRRKRSIKKIRNLNYAYVVSRDNEKDFDLFYYAMYLPYIGKRFGGGAQPASYPTFKDFYRKNGGIIFVLKKNKPIAGILFFLKRKTVYAIGLGAYQGDQYYLKNCACEAALYFLVRWSKKKGLEKLNYGGTVPFFTNGVFKYKKEWGMFAEEDSGQLFCAMKIVSSNEMSFYYLMQNPFICIEENKMKGLFFVNHKLSKEELEKLCSENIFPKIDSLLVISCYDKQKRSTKEADTSLIPYRLSTELGKGLSTICSSFINQGLNLDILKIRKSYKQAEIFENEPDFTKSLKT